MMNEINHGFGMGLVWIIGIFILIVLIWLIVIVMNQKNILKLSNKRSPLDILKKDTPRLKLVKKNLIKKGMTLYRILILNFNLIP